jgi:hypothetical protein
MNVPANPPMERSEVTVKGETTSAISGAFLSSVVSYYSRMSKDGTVQSKNPLVHTTIKLERYFPSITTTFCAVRVIFERSSPHWLRECWRVSADASSHVANVRCISRRLIIVMIALDRKLAEPS